MGMNRGRVTLTPTVPTFCLGEPKDRAVKVLEESAELYAAWQNYERGTGSLAEVRDEAADVVQAVCNMLDPLGVSDMTRAMTTCVARNEQRGRYR